MSQKARVERAAIAAAKRAERARRREKEASARRATKAAIKHRLENDNQLNRGRKGKRREERDWREHERCFDGGLLDCAVEECAFSGRATDVLGERAEERNRAQAIHDATCPGCETPGSLRAKPLTFVELGEVKREDLLSEERERGTADPERRAFERLWAWYSAREDEHAPGQSYPTTVRGYTPPVADARRGPQHPAEIAKRRQRREHPDLDPEEREVRREVRHLEHLVRENQRDGLPAGALRRAMEMWTPQLQDAGDLPGEEHRAAIVEYLVGFTGEFVSAFPETPGREVFSRLLHSHLEAVRALALLSGREVDVEAVRGLWEDRWDRLSPGYEEWRERSRRRLVSAAP